MELAIDLMSALRKQPSLSAQEAGITGIDWAGLHARLASAHAARRELAGVESPAALRDGGFSDWDLVVESAAKGSPGVNRADSTDGKTDRGISDVTVKAIKAGG